MLFMILIIILTIVIPTSKYKKTAYYKITGTSYFRLLKDKGAYGEYLIYKSLQHYEKDGAKFLFNCYVPKNTGETTEIDVMMIHTSGIYVFESKNYSGWIFGNEICQTWNRTLPNNKGFNKISFYNPIRQNRTHIKWLSELIKVDEIPIHSIIVFSNRCVFKNMEINSPDVRVIKREGVVNLVKTFDETYKERISREKVAALYNIIYPHTQVSAEIKNKHIQDIQSRLNFPG